MARSSTTVVKGQQLALKHGAYSASARLARQNIAIDELAQRLKAKKVGPLELQAFQTLTVTVKRQKKASAWLNRHDIINADGDVVEAAAYEERLLKSVHAQVMGLWRMIEAAEFLMTDPQLSEAQERLERFKPALLGGGPPPPAEGVVDNA